MLKLFLTNKVWTNYIAPLIFRKNASLELTLYSPPPPPPSAGAFLKTQFNLVWDHACCDDLHATRNVEIAVTWHKERRCDRTDGAWVIARTKHRRNKYFMCSKLITGDLTSQISLMLSHHHDCATSFVLTYANRSHINPATGRFDRLVVLRMYSWR